MNDDLPPLPEPAFRLLWKHGEYRVTKPNIGDTDVYTADQYRAAVLAERERCAGVCEERHVNGNWKHDTRHECAAAIRKGTP